MSDPTNWYEWIKVAAFVFGLMFGGLAVGSPSWVWLKKQVLSTTAGWLATLGAGLISMSIWQSVEVEGPGFKAKIAELDNALKTANALARQNAGVLASLAKGRELAFGTHGLTAAEIDPQVRDAYADYLEEAARLMRAKVEDSEKPPKEAPGLIHERPPQ